MRDLDPIVLPAVSGAVVGVGVDIIEIGRVRAAIERGGERLVRRVFSEEERRYCSSKREPWRHFAARFAAKEAAIKALRVPAGLGWLWSEIDVTRSDGPPSLRLSGRALDRARAIGARGCHLSLTHSDAHAVAVAVLV